MAKAFGERSAFNALVKFPEALCLVRQGHTQAYSWSLYQAVHASSAAKQVVAVAV